MSVEPLMNSYALDYANCQETRECHRSALPVQVRIFYAQSVASLNGLGTIKFTHCQLVFGRVASSRIAEPPMHDTPLFEFSRSWLIKGTANLVLIFMSFDFGIKCLKLRLLTK